MRLKVTRSKNAASLYVIKSVYNKKTQSNTSEIVEKLGTEKELREKLGGADPYEWARKYIEQLNEKEKEETRTVLVGFSQNKRIEKGKRRSFNGGYLVLQKIYHELKLNKICEDIAKKYKFEYNLDSILSRLIYGRILFPSSKLSTFELSNTLLEPPEFDLHHIYRALEVIYKESDFIQSQLYKNSLNICKRNDKILYYDCTNYFFEIEQEDGCRQYGKSKENRPNPIIGMGLFMDADGIPLAFSMFEGNTNEQQTLKPLEKKIIEDFSMSKFVVCTDAGLSSTANRRFNDRGGRAFITTHSLKKQKAHLKKWSLDPDGWYLFDQNKKYNLNEILNNDESLEKYRNSTFYKERWINENGLEQRLIVTFSIKYRQYQRTVRNRQIERAYKLVQSTPSSLKNHNQNDCKRFITKTSLTDDGEIAKKETYGIDMELISKEAAYDGFYAVCTNLEDDAAEISKINHKRWQIEECFRIMKTEFKTRPVFLSDEQRIKAHFTTCFLALVLYRFLEKRLEKNFTCSEIVDGLRTMEFFTLGSEGYSPSYTRTDFTDAIQEVLGFETDIEIVTNKKMKKIFNDTKK